MARKKKPAAASPTVPEPEFDEFTIFNLYFDAMECIEDQREDGLGWIWANAETDREARLQLELRRLQAILEGDAVLLQALKTFETSHMPYFGELPKPSEIN